MRIELRVFKQEDQTEIRHMILLSESEAESRVIDKVFGDRDFPIHITGEVCLADGYADHYIRLKKLDITPQELVYCPRCNRAYVKTLSPDRKHHCLGITGGDDLEIKNLDELVQVITGDQQSEPLTKD